MIPRKAKRDLSEPVARLMRIDLPWPDKRLSPNSTSHYMAKARAVKHARLCAAWTMREAGIGPISAPAIKVAVTFFPPDNRRRDTDNMFASCKAYFDGIAPVIGVDDSRWSFTLERAEVRKGGIVRVEIEEAA